MNKNRTHTILGILGIAIFFALFLWASNEDYKETILYNMPQQAYATICTKLGSDCTNKQIIKEYLSNKSYYDSTWQDNE